MKKYFFFLQLAVFACFSIPVQADEPPVLYESFSKMNMDFIATNGAPKIDGNFDEYFDHAGWTGQNMYYGYKRTSEGELFTEFNECALPRFGNTKTDSYIITPSLDVRGGVTVSFRVKSFIRNTGGEPTVENSGMKVEYAADGSTFEDIFSVNDMDGILAEKTFTIPESKATATAKIKFNRSTSSENNRFFISDILILKESQSNLNVIRQEEYTVYPTEGRIVFQTKIPLRGQIYTVAGQLIKEIDVQIGEESVSLNQGAYIVRIAGKSQKVVVW